MPIRVAINGFGRIGRNILRSAKQAGRSDIDFVAVNDLTDAKTLAHLLKYDSVHGTYTGDVRVSDDGLVLDGDNIRVLSERDPSALPWAELEVDIVETNAELGKVSAQAEDAKKGLLVHVETWHIWLK